MAAPQMIASTKFYKGLLNKALGWLPLPKVNPNYVSVLSVVAAVAAVVFVKSNPTAFFICAVLSLVLDGLDGMVARKHNLASEEGYVVDVVMDRVSEGIILACFLPWWVAAFGLNVALTAISYKRGVHTILPLKLAFIIYYAVFVL